MKPLQNQLPESQTAHSLSQSAALVIDVRSPGEFAKGRLPNSINLPILTDDERHQVGLTYKTEGNAAATRLGHSLVSGDVRKSRLSAWQTAIGDQPQALLACWRGGARSTIAQTWLSEVGLEVPRIKGGYKSVRTSCLKELEAARIKQWWILGGRTGVGKTIAIQKLRHAIDLEKLAQHRGSAFGRYPGQDDVQPAQATFENELAYEVVRHAGEVLILEDESRMIGRIAIPESWHQKMSQAPVVLLEASLTQRSQHIYEEYVRTPLQQGITPDQLATHLKQCLQRISRRLGGARHQQVDRLLTTAFDGEGEHQAWIAQLLKDYYDPMYDYQLAKKAHRIQFRGDMESVSQYLTSLTD
ncbi:MAG: tRNA 2-selenouridine(34) synthase MnmH [Pseudomonadota bacterium]